MFEENVYGNHACNASGTVCISSDCRVVCSKSLKDSIESDKFIIVPEKLYNELIEMEGVVSVHANKNIFILLLFDNSVVFIIDCNICKRLSSDKQKLTDWFKMTTMTNIKRVLACEGLFALYSYDGSLRVYMHCESNFKIAELNNVLNIWVDPYSFLASACGLYTYQPNKIKFYGVQCLVREIHLVDTCIPFVLNDCVCGLINGELYCIVRTPKQIEYTPKLTKLNDIIIDKIIKFKFLSDNSILILKNNNCLSFSIYNNYTKQYGINLNNYPFLIEFSTSKDNIISFFESIDTVIVVNGMWIFKCGDIIKSTDPNVFEFPDMNSVLCDANFNSDLPYIRYNNRLTTENVDMDCIPKTVTLQEYFDGICSNTLYLREYIKGGYI